MRTARTLNGCAVTGVCFAGMGDAVVRCMPTTQQAAKALAPKTTTTEHSGSVQNTTPNATAYRARSRGSISGEFVIGKPSTPGAAEPSIWGWANRIHFSAERGFWAEPDEAPELPLPLDDE